MIKGGYQRA